MCWRTRNPATLDERFRNNVPIANGSCESRSRREEEVDTRHLRRLSTQRSAATFCWLGRQQLAGCTTSPVRP